MKSRWSERDAKVMTRHLATQDISRDLSLRIYSTRLLGREAQLVLHGGGNTSVKTTAKDLFGKPVDVLCVKGSGWDMSEIEPAGLPAVRLDPILQLRHLNILSDEDLVNVQRLNLLNANSPNPSVETLLHAFLPHQFVDHTHANAVLSITNQPDSPALAREVWGERMGLVPYIMPGFALAKAAADVLELQNSIAGALSSSPQTAAELAEAVAAADQVETVYLLSEHLAANGRASRAAAAAPAETTYTEK